MIKTKKLKKEVKKLKIENKKIENEKRLYITYANNWKSEYYELNKKSFIKDKELAIAKVDLVLNRFYLAAAVVIAIVELAIILF
ncbi:hypothetical protein LDK25_03070 [Fusobacterium nucleatum]|uniref:hypothetical protein n=1 Tax=Fusobacterium nucleatum TaxID=851 RepID=UPI0030ECE47D